jgi:hypothetical protein
MVQRKYRRGSPTMSATQICTMLSMGHSGKIQIAIHLSLVAPMPGARLPPCPPARPSRLTTVPRRRCRTVFFPTSSGRMLRMPRRLQPDNIQRLTPIQSEHGRDKCSLAGSAQGAKQHLAVLPTYDDSMTQSTQFAGKSRITGFHFSWRWRGQFGICQYYS